MLESVIELILLFLFYYLFLGLNTLCMQVAVILISITSLFSSAIIQCLFIFRHKWPTSI